MENTENIILLLTVGQGLLLSIALLGTYRKNKYSNLFTGILMGVLTVEIAVRWSTEAGYFNNANAFPYYNVVSYLLIPASLFLIVKINLKPSFSLRRIHALLFVPALLDTICNLTSHYLAKNFGNQFLLFSYPAWYFYVEILPVVLSVLVIFYFGMELAKIHRLLWLLKNERQSLYKIYTLFVFCSALLGLWILTAIFTLDYHHITQILIVIFLFIFGYMGYANPSFFSLPQNPKGSKSNLIYAQFEDQDELMRLRAAFEVEKVFRKQRLSLKGLAEHLNLPDRYVSWLINHYHDQSYSSYVNSYRVADTIEHIKDSSESHKTLLGIAEDAGFSSKSSFNSVFKEITGKNPSDYL